MKTGSDDLDLAVELRALRPRPSSEFASELDEQAAAGFAAAPGRSRLRGLLERLRALPPRRIVLPVGAAVFAAIVVATVVVNSAGTDSGQGERRLSSPGESTGAANAAPGERPFDGGGQGHRSSGRVTEYSSAPSVSAGEPHGQAAASAGIESSPAPANARAGRRAVERGARIVLGAAPGDVGDDAAKVFDAVHANGGIVLRSSVDDGAEGAGGAEFELLIPAGKLGDALASFSRIDEVRSRRESTLDITAPTVSAGELLRDSRARIDGLLAQLASAESDGERGAVEAELHRERRHAAALRSRLDRLSRRANFARVSLRIESGEDLGAGGAGGRWGIGDALGDAGRILATAAAVSVVACAVLGPLALLALLAWLCNRTWLRRRREQALG